MWKYFNDSKYDHSALPLDWFSLLLLKPVSVHEPIAFLSVIVKVSLESHSYFLLHWTAGFTELVENLKMALQTFELRYKVLPLYLSESRGFCQYPVGCLSFLGTLVLTLIYQIFQLLWNFAIKPRVNITVQKGENTKPTLSQCINVLAWVTIIYCVNI